MIEAYPLCWPGGYKRTPQGSRKRASFQTSLGTARDHLLEQVRLLGGRNVILSSNMPIRQDGIFYANALNPQDPGVAVYFEFKGNPMCFACDRWYHAQDNVRALGKTIEALRGIERWGASDMMERAFLGFKSLPENATQSWRTTLQFPVEAVVSKEMIESRYRDLAKTHHPDKGGDSAKFAEIHTAREIALREVK
jgi:hypothetical protein